MRNVRDMSPIPQIHCLVLAALLAGCGGGGAGSGPVVPPPVVGSVAGLYLGTASGGRTFDVLVLDSGRFYGMLGTNAGGLTNVYIGTGAVTATSFNSTTASDFPLLGGAFKSATLTSTGVPKASLTGTLSGGITFSSSYDPSFEAAPSLATVAGTYRGDASGPEGVGLLTATIDAAGAVTATTLGCSLTGTVTPHAGANVYDITFTFGAGCKARGTLGGHGLLNTTPGPPALTRITVILTSGDFAEGLVFIGSKS